jgi:hypothetical protein
VTAMYRNQNRVNIRQNDTYIRQNGTQAGPFPWGNATAWAGQNRRAFGEVRPGGTHRGPPETEINQAQVSLDTKNFDGELFSSGHTDDEMLLDIETRIGEIAAREERAKPLPDPTGTKGNRYTPSGPPGITASGRRRGRWG